MNRVPIILGLMAMASMAWGQLMFQPSWVSSIASTTDAYGLASGMVLRIDANTGLFVTGTNVTQWNDLTASSIDFAQTTEANQPLYETTGVNGKPCVRFNGAHPASSYLNTDSPNAVPTYTNQTVVIVGQRGLPQSQTYGYFYSHYNAGITKGLVFGFGAGANEGKIDYGRNGASIDTWIGSGLTTNSANVLVFRLNNGTPQFSVWVNGVGWATNANSCEMFSTNVNWTLGAFPIGYGANFKLCEMAVYNREISDSEVSTVTTYLKTKWGIP